MALFTPAFTLSKINEGGWVNDPNDIGGETYRGISRKFNPKWNGWSVIDEMKKKGLIKKNYTDSKLDSLAEIFYKEKFWNPIKGDEIKNQEVANQLYDHTLSGLPRSISMMKAVLNKKFGYNLGEGGSMDNETIKAINTVDNGKLFNEYKTARADFFKYSATKLTPSDSIYFDLFKRYNSKPSASNSVYVKGWLNRVNKYVYSGIEQVTETVKKNPIIIASLTFGIIITSYIFYKTITKNK
jgi:hypothetical protein